MPSVDDESNIGLVDTHCHLRLLQERGLLDAAMENAAVSGVHHIVTVGLNADDSVANCSLAETLPGVSFSVGWHPHEPRVPDAAQLETLSTLLAHPRAVAVGEVGLDKYWRPGYHDVPLDVQTQSLHCMLELASAYSRPVIVHNRDANVEILEELARWPELSIVMHCFSAGWTFAEECVTRGYVISFSGIVTFPRSEELHSVAAKVRDDGFVVETDAPFLAPVPHRGAANLPGYVAHTAVHVAQLRSTDLVTVAHLTTATAKRVFGIDESNVVGA